MAEFCLRDMLEKSRLDANVTVSSAATSAEELGNPVYPPARRKLREHGIDCFGKTARQITRADYGKYDIIVGMDCANVRNMLRIFGGDPENKIRLLLNYAGLDRDVADPWYTDDFDAAWDDIEKGCAAMVQRIASGEEL